MNPIEDRITQIAVIKTGGIREDFSTLVNPEKEISEFITNLTGISNDNVKDAPKEKEALEKLINFFEDDYVIVAQNAPFDLGFLYYAFLRNGLNPIIPNFYCTRTMSAILFPNLSHKLVDITNLFDIKLEKEHNAIYDTEATEKLFNKLINIGSLYKIDFMNKLVEHPDRPMFYKPENATIIKSKSK